jgi:hypothetical protein
MADELICPICGEKAKPIDNKTDTTGFDCVNHDKFYVTGTALEEDANRSKQEWEVALKRAKEHAEPGEWPIINSYDFPS